jgi:hypothetical protein
MTGQIASNPLNVCSVVVANCIGNVQKRRAAAIAPEQKERNLIQRHIEVADMRKENCKGEEQSELPRDLLGGPSSLSEPHQSNPTQLHCVKTTQANKGTADRGEKRPAPHAALSVATGISESWSVSIGS